MESSERDGNTRQSDMSPEKSDAGQKAAVRTGHETTDWFQIGKEYIMKSRLPGEISITSDMQMTPPLWQKVKKN